LRAFSRRSEPSREDSKRFVLPPTHCLLTTHSLDLVYFGRETAWQPAEGLVPGPDPRHRLKNDDADEDEDDGNGVMINDE